MQPHTLRLHVTTKTTKTTNILAYFQAHYMCSVVLVIVATIIVIVAWYAVCTFLVRVLDEVCNNTDRQTDTTLAIVVVYYALVIAAAVVVAIICMCGIVWYCLSQLPLLLLLSFAL